MIFKLNCNLISIDYLLTQFFCNQVNMCTRMNVMRILERNDVQMLDIILCYLYFKLLKCIFKTSLVVTSSCKGRYITCVLLYKDKKEEI